MTEIKLYSPDKNRIAVLLNDTSHLSIITNNGLERSETWYPQILVDYDRTDGVYRHKITGVDIL